MTRYLGGLITKDESLVLPANNYEDTSAPGVWTLEEAQALNKQGLWPTAGVSNPAKFVENIFSVDVYTGNGSDNNNIVNGVDLSVLSLFKLSINFIIDVRSLDKLSTLFSSNEILANFDMCFTVFLSIDI